MFLARLKIKPTRQALNWLTNPYRIHQRLMMAYDGEPRLLFRKELFGGYPLLLVQSRQEPDWQAAFAGFPVLMNPPECKPVELKLHSGQMLRFRLLANPTVKRDGKRLGLLVEAEQEAWLARKLLAAGCALKGCSVASSEMIASHRDPQKDPAEQHHLAVLFDGLLQVLDPEKLLGGIEAGIGSAKGYGFGLLSVAPE